MKSKRCFKCEAEKPLSDYYAHKEMGDGHLNKCKDCTKADSKKRHSVLKVNDNYVELERKRAREKYHRLYSDVGYKPPKINNISRKRYPEKYAANSSAASIKSAGLERHHWSYNEQHYKDLIFLAKKDHMKAHRFIIYDQEQMMYRRTDTNELLDTKERHEAYIKWCIENKED